MIANPDILGGVPFYSLYPLFHRNCIVSKTKVITVLSMDLYYVITYYTLGIQT